MIPYYALTRFGRWEEMLKEPEPPSNAVLRAVWHYATGAGARGHWSRRRGGSGIDAAAGADVRRIDEAAALLAEHRGARRLRPPRKCWRGKLPPLEATSTEPIAHLERSVRLEDSLVYTEPSEFHFPPRHALGAVLLEAGRPLEAETVYWEDLRRNQDNGWALFGLLQALRAQGKTDNAALVEARLAKAWARADVTFTASRFGRPVSPGRPGD